MRNRSGARTALIVFAAALLLVGAIILIYLFVLSDDPAPQIVLPDVEASEKQPEVETPEQEDNIVVVNADNVLQVLHTLIPVDSYRQFYVTTTVNETGSIGKTVEILRNGDVYQALLSDARAIRHYLTDGQTLYLWYDGDQAVQKLPMAEGFSFDDLIGIPDYLQELESAEILDAAFVPTDENASERIYVHAITAAGSERQYWIDLSTARLVRADLLEDQQLTYQIQQYEFSTLVPNDPLFIGAFCLPDGTEPFLH